MPHSDIPGSTVARTFPGLIAACHVLHRLSTPRHPPDALRYLEQHPAPAARPDPGHPPRPVPPDPRPRTARSPDGTPRSIPMPMTPPDPNGPGDARMSHATPPYDQQHNHARPRRTGRSPRDPAARHQRWTDADDPRATCSTLAIPPAQRGRPHPRTGAGRLRSPPAGAGGIAGIRPRLPADGPTTRRHGTADLVGLGRVERPTSRLSGVRSNHLSYRPRAAEPGHPRPDRKGTCGSNGRRRGERDGRTGPRPSPERSRRCSGPATGQAGRERPDIVSLERR